MACRLAMIEQPRAGSAAAAPQSDVLLATKLHLPASRPGLVSRSRLAERLDEGLAQGLIVVCAPTGYGKTVLLADWARRSEHPAGWLSLDGGDNAPARFWRHVVAALDRAQPGIADGVAPLLPPPAPPSFEPLLGALINELAARRAASTGAGRQGRGEGGGGCPGRGAHYRLPAGICPRVRRRRPAYGRAAGPAHRGPAVDTVKKHVGHVLGKLGAANRTEAVAGARELSLIP